MDSRVPGERARARTYWMLAGLAWLVGAAIMIEGHTLKPFSAGQPIARQLVAPILSGLLLAAGCLAAGFAKRPDTSAARTRAVLWLSVGPAMLLATLVAGALALASAVRAGRHLFDTRLEYKIVEILSIAGSVVFLYWVFQLIYRLRFFGPGMEERETLVSLFRAKPQASIRNLRSAYEQKIRQAATQEERNRLARDLHDSIKQQIFVIQTAAATAQARFDADPLGAREALDQVRSSARDTIAELQVMLEHLGATPLENIGLVEALKKQCEALGLRTGAQLDFTVGDLPSSNRVAPGAQEAIFRAAQEALSNISRHARAKTVQVSLNSIAEHLELRIRDDGVGFDPNLVPRGMGLRNIRDRVEEVGGEMELMSHPGSGTSIRISIPYERAYSQSSQRERDQLLVAIFVLAFTLSLYWSGVRMTAVVVLNVALVALYAFKYVRARWAR